LDRRPWRESGQTGDPRRSAALRKISLTRLEREVQLLAAQGSEPSEAFALAAQQVARILRGAKPGDLPVEQPSHYLLVINLDTAKALDLAIPSSLLQRADEVIR